MRTARAADLAGPASSAPPATLQGQFDRGRHVGGIGMTDEFDIGLFLKRARLDSVMFGDAAFHTDRAATMLGY